MAVVQPQAGPSRPRKTEPTAQQLPTDDVAETRATPPAAAATTTPARPGETEEGDEDEELMDLKTIQSIAK